MNCAYCGDCDLVGDVMFNQTGASHTGQSVLEISKDTGIRWSSSGRIIRDLFRATRSERVNVSICVANVFLGSVATRLR